MFHLESSIVAWRQQMLAAGIKSPVPLEELENHLREDIERQVEAGLNEQTAFEISVRQVGQPKMLKSEFKKSERTSMKTLLPCAGVLLAGIAAQLPGSLQLRDQLVMSDRWLGLWLLGLIFQMGSLESLRQIIQPKLTGRALKKIAWSIPEANLKTATGATVLLVSIALMVPAATQAIHDGVVTFNALGGLLFGISLLIAGTLLLCFPYQRRTA